MRVGRDHIQSLVELEYVIVATVPYFEHIAPLTYSLCSKALRYWDFLALSETIWHLMVADRNWDLVSTTISSWHFFCIMICYNMNAHVMNWNKLLEIEGVTKCCIFPNHNSSDLILFYGFPAVSWKYIGFFFIVLLLFHPQCAGSLVVLA